MNRSTRLAIRLAATLVALLAAFALASCGGDDDDATPPETPEGDDDGETLADVIEIDAGAMTVRITRDPYSMAIAGPDDSPLLSTATWADADSPTGRANLSPMLYLPHAFQTGELSGDWYYAREVVAVERDANVTKVFVRAADALGGPAEASLAITFRVVSNTHLSFSAIAWGADGIHYHCGAYRLDDDEEFFGLGLQYDSIGSRGTLRPMFIGLGPDVTDRIQNHAPMPFYISSRGYGLFVADKGRGYFDMGYSNEGAYGYKYRTPELTTHVFYGPDPLAIIDQYTQLAGRPPMNPDYLFGHLHWRNVNHDESEMYSDMAELRARGIPTSSFMVDAPWATAYNTYDFAECDSGCLFKDAQAVIDTAHEQGFAFYVWTAEFIDRVSPVEAPGMVEDNSAQWNPARAAGYLMPIFGLIYEYPWWHESGAIVNFFDPRGARLAGRVRSQRA